METNKIYHGDCLELMPQIASGSIDMILCDLPYGTTQCKWDTIIPFDKLWEQYERLIKPNGVIALTASQPFTSALVMSNPKLFKYEWIWNKNTASGFANAKRQPMRTHENILIFYKLQPTYNPIKEIRDLSKKSKERHNYKFNSSTGINNEVYGKLNRLNKQPEDLAYPKTVQKINGIVNNHNERIHPTQKPVALFEYLVKTYTNEGETVLDNCIGSGTTAIACKNTKRKFIGMEREQKYFDMANKRIEFENNN